MSKGRDYWFQQVSQSSAQHWAAKFFVEKRCVVGSTEERHLCDWHHLDENRKNNPRIGNLVPLARGLNQAIDTTGGRRSGQLPSELGEFQLRTSAQSHWARGEFPYCYGVNRLAAFLALSHWNRPSDSLLFATEALHALRPLWDEWLAIDTIERSILPLLCSERSMQATRLSALSLASMCKEVASWFLCCHEHGQFESWMILGQAFARTAHSADPDQSALTIARLKQHHGILLYQAGNLAASRKAIEYADAIMRDLRYSHGTSNNHQYLARIALESSTGSINDTDRRLDELEEEFGVISPVNEWRPGQTHTEFWTGVGLMCLKAEVKWRQQKKTLAHDLAQSVASLLGRKKIKVMEVFHDPSCISAFSEMFPSDARSLAAFANAPIMCIELRTVADDARRRIQDIAHMYWRRLGHGTI